MQSDLPGERAYISLFQDDKRQYAGKSPLGKGLYISLLQDDRDSMQTDLLEYKGLISKAETDINYLKVVHITHR